MARLVLTIDITRSDAGSYQPAAVGKATNVWYHGHDMTPGKLALPYEVYYLFQALHLF